MTNLLLPELNRYLTRRVTLLGAAGLMLLGALLPLTDKSGSPSGTYLGNAVDALTLVTILCSTFSYFTAASYLGSDQSSGALGTWLTFNPRRCRVLTAKFLAVSLPAATLTLVSAVITLLCTIPVSVVGSTTPLDAVELLGMVLRAIVIAVGFALLGLVIALVGRNTLSALGALVGYLVLVLIQAYAVATLRLRSSSWIGIERLLNDFLMAKEYEVAYRSIHPPPVPPQPSTYFSYSQIATAGLWWILILAGAVALGFWVFSRRDVN